MPAEHFEVYNRCNVVYNRIMKTVFLISLRSTGQLWDQRVAANQAAVERVMAAQEMVSDGEIGGVLYWKNPKDASQTATAMLMHVAE